jgi:hypothetical protein
VNDWDNGGWEWGNGGGWATDEYDSGGYAPEPAYVPAPDYSYTPEPDYSGWDNSGWQSWDGWDYSDVGGGDNGGWSTVPGYEPVAPAPEMPVNPYGTNVYDPYYNQPSPVYETVPGYEQAAPVPNPQEFDAEKFYRAANSLVNQGIGNAGAPAKDDYFGNIWYGVTKPWTPDAKENQNWLESGWDFANRAAGSVLGGLGGAVAPVGDIVDTVAEANIPVVSGVADATRFGWEHVVEPVSNAIPALVGTLADGAWNFDENGNWLGFDAGAARADYLANDPNLVYDRVYQSELANGATEIDARQKAERERGKMNNVFNRMFAGGTEEFSTLAPVVQLGVGMLDPVANKFGDWAISGTPLKSQGRLPFGERVPDTAPVEISNPIAPLALVGRGAEWLGDVTGFSDAMVGLGQRLESPQQKANEMTLALEQLDPRLTEYVSGMETNGQFANAASAFEEIVNNPDSPIYYENLYANNPVLGERVAGAIRDVLDPARYQFEQTAANLKVPDAPGGLSDRTLQRAGEISTRYENDAAMRAIETDLPYSAEFGMDIQTPGDIPLGAAGRLNDLIQDYIPVRHAAANTPPKLDGFTLEEAWDYSKAPSVAERAAKVQYLLDNANPIGEIKTTLENDLRTFKGSIENAQLWNDTFENPARVTDPLARAANPATPAAMGTSLSSQIDVWKPRAGQTRPDYVKDLKLPDYANANVSQFVEAINTAYQRKIGAQVRDAKSQSGWRNARNLEQWGAVGAGFRLAGKPVGFMSRTMLATPSRFVRDTLGNIVKYTIEGYGLLGESKVKNRFENTGGIVPADLTGGASKDTGLTAKQGESKLATALYTLLNPPVELANIALRKASETKRGQKILGGTWQDFNAATEATEGWIKGKLYRRAYNDAYEKWARETISDTPEYAALLEKADIRPGAGAPMAAQVASFVAGKMPKDASLPDLLTGNHNPANFSPSVIELQKAVEQSQFAAAVAVLDTIQEKLDAYNKWKIDSHVGKMKEGDAKKRAISALTESLEDIDINHPVFTGLRGSQDATIPQFDENGKEIGRIKTGEKQLITTRNSDKAPPILKGIFEEIKEIKKNVLDGVAQNEATQLRAKLKDPQLEAIINYANKERGLKALTDYLTLEQIKREARYEVNYAGADIVDRTQSLKAKAQKRSGVRDPWDTSAQRIDPYDAIPELADVFENVDAETPDASARYYMRTYGDVYTKQQLFNRIKDLEASETRPLRDFEIRDLVEQIYNDVDSESFARWNDVLTQKDTYQSAYVKGKMLYGRANDVTDIKGRRMSANARHYYGFKASRLEHEQMGVLPPDRLQRYVDAIYRDNPGATPNDLRNMAAKFGARGKEQRGRFIQDMLSADEYVREISGNRYKLDLTGGTFEPVGIFDEKPLRQSLAEMKDGTYQPVDPATIERPFKRKPPANWDEALTRVNKILDAETATKRFADMDAVEADLIRSRIAQELLGVDGNDPHIARQGVEQQARDLDAWLDALKADVGTRYQTAAKARKERAEQYVQTREQNEITREQAQVDAANLARELLALRTQGQIRASQEAYSAMKDRFFDYNSKNVIDQALNSVLPFNYWARQNFAFMARHFAEHPMHFAAILNFYSELEEENRRNNIPEYARANILLWTNPDGSKVMWNFNSLFPYSPLGSSDATMKVVASDDPEGERTANKEPLAVLFGSDKPGGGRDKGIVAEFLRPNPIIDIATKTGKPNEIMRSLGLVTDGFGGAGKQADQTIGLLPGRSFYRDVGAATGATKALRDGGFIKSDLDIEAPVNEMLFGRNAGKPISKLKQELTYLTQNGRITQEQAYNALIGLQENNWTPEALMALDLVEADSAPTRLRSLVGWQTLEINQKRQQLGENISKTYAGIKERKGTPYENENASRDFFAKNPGASVAFSGSKSAGELRQGMADDRTRAAQSELYAQLKAKKISGGEFNKRLNALEDANPDYFTRYPAKESRQERDAKQAAYDKKSREIEANKAWQAERRKYQDVKRDYDNFMSDYIRLKEAGRTKEANAIYASEQFKKAKAKRDGYLAANPAFKERYERENAERYPK